MIDQEKLRDVLGALEDLQNTKRATQEEKDAMRRAKSALLTVLE